MLSSAFNFVTVNNFNVNSLTLQERIVAICTHYRLNRSELATIAGTHVNTINKMATGLTKEMSLTTANNIIKSLEGINPEFVYSGAGPILKPVGESKDIELLQEKVKSLSDQLTMAMRVNQLLEEKLKNEDAVLALAKELKKYEKEVLEVKHTMAETLLDVQSTVARAEQRKKIKDHS